MKVPTAGSYQVILSTDESKFGGYDRISKEYVYTATKKRKQAPEFKIYLPARTALIMKKVK